jgi:CheY-like chemotaxis protein
MSPESDGRSIILVLEDVEETRDGMEKLLTASGYRVIPATSEADAMGQAGREPPNLILVSLDCVEESYYRRRWKIDVLKLFTRLVQRLAERKRNVLQEGTQPLKFSRGRAARSRFSLAPGG